MVMPVGGSMPLASALAVAAVPVVPLSAMATVSLGAKPLPEAVTRPPRFAVVGVIVRVAVAGLAVAFGFGVAVAVAFGCGVAVAVAFGVDVVVAVGVGVEVASASEGGSLAARGRVARVAP